jgi:hypothetical protein
MSSGDDLTYNNLYPSPQGIDESNPLNNGVPSVFNDLGPMFKSIFKKDIFDELNGVVNQNDQIFFHSMPDILECIQLVLIAKSIKKTEEDKEREKSVEIMKQNLIQQNKIKEETEGEHYVIRLCSKIENSWNCLQFKIKPEEYVLRVLPKLDDINIYFAIQNFSNIELRVSNDFSWDYENYFYGIGNEQQKLFDTTITYKNSIFETISNPIVINNDTISGLLNKHFHILNNISTVLQQIINQCNSRNKNNPRELNVIKTSLLDNHLLVKDNQLGGRHRRTRRRHRRTRRRRTTHRRRKI